MKINDKRLDQLISEMWGHWVAVNELNSLASSLGRRSENVHVRLAKARIKRLAHERQLKFNKCMSELKHMDVVAEEGENPNEYDGIPF